MAKPPNIRSGDELREALERLSPALQSATARFIAIRAGLRVLPLVVLLLDERGQTRLTKRLVLAVCNVSLSAKRRPADAADAVARATATVTDAARAARTVRTTRAASAAVATVYAADAEGSVADVANTAAAAATPDDARAAAETYEQIEIDFARALEGSEAPVNDKLWRRPPSWALEARRSFRLALEDFGGAWPFWSRWYDCVFEGDGLSDSIEAPLDALLDRDDEFWDRDPDEVMADIGRAVGWPQPLRDKEPTPEASIQQLAELASPQAVLVEKGRRLDAIPNAIYDALKADRAYFLVAEAQAVLSQNIHDAAPENVGRSLRVFLTSYSVELSKRRVAPNALKLQQAGQIIGRDFDSEETAYWSKGLEQAIASWRDNHIAIMAYLSENARREADFARIPVDESPKALAQLRRELSRFGEAARALSEAGQTTERFDEAVEELQEQGKLIEALPELLLDQPLSQAVSVRKRFILSAIGFVAKTARVVGLAGTAYLISNPGQALATFASIVDSILGILKTLLAP